MIKEGRYGPYVTDGETNASLRRGDEVESITVQRAIELLAERRAAGPATPAQPVVRDRAAVAGRALRDAAVGEFVPEPSVVYRGRLTPARGPAPAPRPHRAARPHGAPQVPPAAAGQPRATAGQPLRGPSSRPRSP